MKLKPHIPGRKNYIKRHSAEHLSRHLRMAPGGLENYLKSIIKYLFLVLDGLPTFSIRRSLCGGTETNGVVVLVVRFYFFVFFHSACVRLGISGLGPQVPAQLPAPAPTGRKGGLESTGQIRGARP